MTQYDAEMPNVLVAFPPEELTMTFGEYLAKNGKNMEKKVYAVPQEIDREVALIKLNSTGINIDVLTPEQEEYLARVE